jgi:predicted O-methyltransferase YrrM
MDGRWLEVDSFLEEQLLGSDPVLEATLAANAAAGLPSIDVAPLAGKLLHLLALMIGARRILEIGTLGGYSTIWMARALGEGGRVITLEADERHAEVARANFARAGVADRIELRLGRALDTLPGLVGEAPFDLIFIDADKPAMPDYLSWALKLSRPGTVIVGDNVVRGGQVAGPASSDPWLRGVQRFLEMIGEDDRLTGTALQVVGARGWDGLAIAVVRERPPA